LWSLLIVVGSVILVTQIGCAIALLLLVPLGDRADRRRLMLLQLFALVLALTAVSITKTAVGLFASMFAVGMLGTAMTLCHDTGTDCLCCKCCRIP